MKKINILFFVSLICTSNLFSVPCVPSIPEITCAIGGDGLPPQLTYVPKGEIKDSIIKKGVSSMLGLGGSLDSMITDALKSAKTTVQSVDNASIETFIVQQKAQVLALSNACSASTALTSTYLGTGNPNANRAICDKAQKATDILNHNLEVIAKYNQTKDTEWKGYEDTFNKFLDGMKENSKASMANWYEATKMGAGSAVKNDLKQCIQKNFGGNLQKLLGGSLSIALPCGTSFGIDNPLVDAYNNLIDQLNNIKNSFVNDMYNNLDQYVSNNLDEFCSQQPKIQAFKFTQFNKALEQFGNPNIKTPTTICGSRVDEQTETTSWLRQNDFKYTIYDLQSKIEKETDESKKNQMIQTMSSMQNKLRQSSESCLRATALKEKLTNFPEFAKKLKDGRSYLSEDKNSICYTLVIKPANNDDKDRKGIVWGVSYLNNTLCSNADLNPKRLNNSESKYTSSAINLIQKLEELKQISGLYINPTKEIGMESNLQYYYNSLGKILEQKKSIEEKELESAQKNCESSMQNLRTEIEKSNKF